ncbi:unnamed protein product [Gongylonema pulchrum]|uniref:Uncharacterized protein n=1 Tax=Gongylonema pulchrum TaxID=637853 RepID=A0A183EWM5_9BILA|nr:unnamed protein product [Gongylonema pulchrum]
MIARQMKQSRMEGAGSIPVEALLELKAMLSIPDEKTEPIEEVLFVEPPLERIGDAIDLVLRQVFFFQALFLSQTKKDQLDVMWYSL